MTNTNTNSAKVLKKLRDNDYEPRSYSGRAMYGKECIGLSLPDRHGLDNLKKLVGSMPRMDSLGMGIIVYWPEFEWPKKE